MDNDREKVIAYYKHLESRLGYSIFTWDAKHFGYYPDDAPVPDEKKAQELMQDLLAEKLEIKKNAIILDAGSGRGVVSTYLAKKYGAKVIGIDIVPFEIQKARKRVKEMGLEKKVEIYEMDYSHTTFPDNYFDAIYSMETLVHSPQLAVTLQEFNRILKPKGKLVMFEYSRSYPKDFSQRENKMLEVINRGSAMMSLDTLYHPTWIKLIKGAGFIPVTDENITKNMLPSAFRFYRYSHYPYQLIKSLHLQKFFINTTAGVEFYHFLKKGLIQYRVLTARKA